MVLFVLLIQFNLFNGDDFGEEKGELGEAEGEKEDRGEKEDFFLSLGGLE